MKRWRSTSVVGAYLSAQRQLSDWLWLNDASADTKRDHETDRQKDREQEREAQQITTLEQHKTGTSMGIKRTRRIWPLENGFAPRARRRRRALCILRRSAGEEPLHGTLGIHFEMVVNIAISRAHRQ